MKFRREVWRRIAEKEMCENKRECRDSESANRWAMLKKYVGMPAFLTDKNQDYLGAKVMFRARLGTLPTMAYLHRVEIIASPNCMSCPDCPETIEHCLVSCVDVNENWTWLVRALDQLEQTDANEDIKTLTRSLREGSDREKVEALLGAWVGEVSAAEGENRASKEARRVFLEYLARVWSSRRRNHRERGMWWLWHESFL